MVISVDVAAFPKQAYSWHNRTCIAIDVLRATSTIIMLLERGAGFVVPVASKRQGFVLVQKYDYLLCEDKKFFKSKGLVLENSPVEINQQNIQNQNVVLCTVNGSRLITKLIAKNNVLIGSYLNAYACAYRAFKLSQSDFSDIGIACAGNFGEYALDDFACAGFMVKTLIEILELKQIPYRLSETAMTALRLDSSYRDIHDMLLGTWSAEYLYETGQSADINFCGQKNISQLSPIVYTDADFLFIR